MEQPFFDHLLALARAGANVLHIASYEWERVRGFVIGLSEQLELPLQTWSSSSGLMRWDDESALEEVDGNATDPIEVIRTFHRGESSGMLLLEDIHPYLEPQHHQVTRWLREMCRIPASPRKLIILSTPLSGLPPELHKEVPSLELPLPRIEDLRTVCEGVAEELGIRVERDDTELLEAARGLTVMEARLAFGQAGAQQGQLGGSVVPLILQEKKRILRQSEILEYYEPDAQMSDVGGLENLKEWLDRRGRAFGAGAREFGLDAPKGVLLLGVQGCGKSLVAKAIAAAWQRPLLRFDMGKVFGGIVGQSEANLRSALHVAKALAPCVLWIDEIEKGLAGMGSSDQSDAGTTARVVGTLLTWMQEKRDPVFVVATANRIDMLPPELLRKGRFDELFFVDLPTRTIRKEILSIHLRKKRREPADFELDTLAELSAGFSGAELEEAIREGLFNAFAEGKELATGHVAASLKATYPLSRTVGTQLEDLRRWARVRARLASREESEPLNPEAPSKVPRLRQEMRSAFIPESKP
ncbi:AAA family ATPase [Archangium violaceum]|uniref:AAA family ATPase n=1 Tax=Archangium violaceum TaxID=83451 RepID=UPI002B2E525C|nr:AAA family ATPase [Archangium gephyra]